MAEQFYTILTAVGKAKIANAAALGEKVELTHLALGDGGGSYYNPTENQTSLRNEVWRGAIGTVDVDTENPNWIVIQTVVPSQHGGFMIREAGVFDNEGDLIAVGKYPETYKPVAADGSIKDLVVRMILEVSNTASVVLKVDPTVVLATQQQVEEAEARAKAYTDQEVAEVSQALASHLADKVAHQGVPTGAILMWSGSADSIPEGWGLCDGSTYQRVDGTGTITAPDLRDRFIVGAGNEYNVGDIGGEKSVILTESQMPRHRHDKGSLSTTLEGEHNHDGGGYTSTVGNHRHTYDSVIISDGIVQTGQGWGTGARTDYTGYAGSHNHSFSITSDGEHSHNITGATSYVGNSEAHENRPPYYALCFIMKL